MDKTEDPVVSLAPAAVPAGGEFILSGDHWPDAPVSLRLGRARAPIIAIDRGTAESGGILPQAGSFSVRISTKGLLPGPYRIRVVPRSGARTRYLRVEVVAATA